MPGVLTTIAPKLRAQRHRQHARCHGTPQRSAVLQWNPEFLASTERLLAWLTSEFRREIDCLEFAFKPLRMIEVDVPTARAAPAEDDLVHGVPGAEHGRRAQPVKDDGTFETQPEGRRRSVPSGAGVRSNDRSGGERVRKAYLDRIVPAAVGPSAGASARGVAAQQCRSRRAALISDGRIDRGVWGVAMWEDVDPQIDFFSIYVRGLSNASRWTDPEARSSWATPGTGPQFTYKTLQLNFWRPGDEMAPNEREIRFGAPPTGRLLRFRRRRCLPLGLPVESPDSESRPGWQASRPPRCVCNRLQLPAPDPRSVNGT